MSELAALVVGSVTRAWLRAYTAGLASEVAICRREEVESDLWEMRQDPEPAGSWVRVFLATLRLVKGIPDDVGWRMEVAPHHQQLLTRRVIAVVAAIVVVSSLWSAPTLLLKGRRELTTCAETAPTPRDTAALRHEVLRCAGTFFAKRD